MVSEAPVVSAASSCLGDDYNFHVGVQGTSAYTIEGVNANPVFIQQGAVCFPSAGYGNDALSTAWDMIASQDANEWAQSGWIYVMPGAHLGNPNCWTIFSEIVEPNENNWFFPNPAVCVSNGDRHYFWQTNEYCGCGQLDLLHSGYDTHTLQTTTYNPLGSQWAQPLQLQVAGETIYSEGDVPGTTTNKVLFQNVAAQRTDGYYYYACNTTTASTVQVGFTGFNEKPSRYSESVPSGYCPGSSGVNNVYVWTYG